MRQCIELGLHQRPSSCLSAIEEQCRRNVFWDCYIHDRYSSGILGRPFAIAEQDIQIGLPIEATENYILQSGSRNIDNLFVDPSVCPNEASVFRFIVRLRRLTTRIHTRFFSSKRFSSPDLKTITAAGQVHAHLAAFLTELKECQESAPFFTQPRSLYERTEWHEFMVEKDKLTLIRGAIANLPLSGAHPPKSLVTMCLDCATRVIELYNQMFTSGLITWTRSYFQILFTSGLSTMFSLSSLRSSPDHHDLANSVERASQALVACSELLSRFVSEMPDAGRFAAVFGALSKQYTSPSYHNAAQDVKESLHLRGSSQTNPQNSTFADQEPMIRAEDANMVMEKSLDTIDPQFSPSAFELDLDHFEDWSLFAANADSSLGQMEAGLGQYVWDAQGTNNNSWEQYFMH